MSNLIATSFFSARLFAAAADYILIAGSAKTILFILAIFLSGATETNVSFILVALMPTLYYYLFEMSSFRATPGKMLAQLQAVSIKESAASVFGCTLLASAVYWIMGCLSMCVIWLLLFFINLAIKTNLSFSDSGWAALLVSWYLACVPLNTKLGSRTILDIVSRKKVEPRVTPHCTLPTQFLWAVVVGFSAALLRATFHGDTPSIFFGTVLWAASGAYLVAAVLKSPPTNSHEAAVLPNKEQASLVQENTGLGTCTLSESHELQKKRSKT